MCVLPGLVRLDLGVGGGLQYLGINKFRYLSSYRYFNIYRINAKNCLEQNNLTLSVADYKISNINILSC